MSHERSITVRKGGKFFNIPTVVGGFQLTPEAANDLFQRGVLPSLDGKEYGSIKSAVSAAKKRSKKLGPRKNK